MFYIEIQTMFKVISIKVCMKMSYKQKTLIDIIKMVNTEVGLSALSGVLLICSIFMPFIGFYTKDSSLIVLTGVDLNLSITGIKIMGGYITIFVILLAAFSMAARRSSKIFSYKNILDKLCFITIFFILIKTWWAVQVLKARYDILPQIGYIYPSIGVFMLIISGICLFFAGKKQDRI